MSREAFGSKSLRPILQLRSPWLPTSANSVHPTTILLGEVGLAGEVRAVSQIEKRLREVGRQGFTRAVISRHNAGKLPKIDGLEVVPVGGLHEALAAGLLAPGK